MSEPSYCPQGGWVVSIHPVPDDASDHWAPGLRDVIGCNRLNCLSCGSKVRSALNLKPAVESLDSKKLLEMAGTEDWSSLPYVKKSHGCRLYACECFYRHEVSKHLAEENDRDRRQDITFPWACGGHPPPSLPLTVDGWDITADTDIAALATRALSEGAPAEAALGFREYPAGWLGRIYYRLRGLAEADTLGRAVGDLLFSDDLEHVGGALAFYRHWRSAPGGERVLELADAVGAGQTFPSKFDILQMPESPGATLVVQVWGHESLDSKVVHHLEALALDPGAGGMNRKQLDGLFAALARHDGEFLAREAPNVALGKGRRAGAVLRALQGAERAELVVVAGTALIQAGTYATALEGFLESSFSHNEPWTPVLRSALEQAGAR
jgi:hypothetical protein